MESPFEGVNRAKVLCPMNILNIMRNMGANVYDKDKKIAYGSSVTNSEKVGIEFQGEMKKRRVDDE